MLPSHWKRLDDQRAIYRYHSTPQQKAAAHCPVLFLRGRFPDADDALAARFWQDGFESIYVLAGAADNDPTAHALGEQVDWLLQTHHPGSERLILVGCGEGGLLARRYIFLGGHRRVAYLFTLGSAHRYSSLASLYKDVVESRVGGSTPLPVDIPVLDGTVMVNVYGEAKGTGFDGVVQGVHLAEAVNVPLVLGHDTICRDELSYEAVRSYLQGLFWLVTVRLRALDMRGPQEADRTGPFCFEINGWRVPFDGAFRVPVGERHDFDPAQARLATMAFPLADAAVDIDFRLKDLTRTRTQPRKLLTSLHTPLLANRVSEHVLQDSLGSEVCVQVCCSRPEPVLEPDHD